MTTPPLPFSPGPRRTFEFSEACRRHASDGGTPKWSPIKSSRPGPCFECVTWLYEHKVTLPFPCPARYRRKSAVGELKLCEGHGRLWRQLDGLIDPKE